MSNTSHVENVRLRRLSVAGCWQPERGDVRNGWVAGVSVRQEKHHGLFVQWTEILISERLSLTLRF